MSSASNPLTKKISPKSSTDLTESVEVNLVSITYSNKIDKIIQFLDKNPEFDLLSIRDARLYTLIHISCLNNQKNICQLLLNHAKRLKKSAQDIKEWVNQKTDEGFTALHFASFKGNIELVKLLEMNEADIHCKNNQGLSVIHIAAQGDQPVSIAYFKHKGLSLIERDKKGSTPLHWAAFLGMENAATYLTAWGCSANITDDDSALTPLHLAVISGNPRVVRRLLIKGADKNLRNREGKLAIDLALENEYETIVQLLKDKSKIMKYFNVKPDLGKKKTRSSLYLFLFLYSTILVTNFFFVFPYIESLVWVLLFGVVTSATLFLFCLVWLTNPGYLKNPHKEDVLNLLLNNDPHLVCPECIIVKPLRSKHCEFCNSCVTVYDHHCPWVNNCIGARNHGYFLVFIMTTLVALVSICAFGGYHADMSEPVYEYFPLFIYKKPQTLFILKIIVCAIDILIALIFVIPLFALNYVQVGNFFAGKTTSERFGFNASRDNLNQTLNQSISSVAEDGYARIKENHRSFSQFYINCRFMCCLNKKDKRYIYRVDEISNKSSRSLDNENLSP